MEASYGEHKGDAKRALARRQKTIKLGRRISVEEIEKIVEDYLEEATS